MKRKLFIFISLAAVAALSLSCSKGNYMTSRDKGMAMPAESDAYMGEGSGSNYPGPGSGVVTAAEWNDLTHWKEWGELVQGTFRDAVNTWGFYTEGRISVQVVNPDGDPVCGVKVDLLQDGSVAWTARTDNHGLAECWPSLYDGTVIVNADALQVSLDGVLQEERPKVTWLQTDEVRTNRYVLDGKSLPEYAADIAFIVDATGSMADEIAFLQSDMADIINQVMVSQSGMKIRTGAVFYRDEGDDYLTKVSNFNSELSVTRDYILEQYAAGGGDYPEAVHSALSASLQELSWNENTRTRIAFLLLDAPPHDQADVKESVRKSVQTYARMGIKLIPIAASGIDKGTEALLRMMAISTDATYVFITNDSGVGGDHIEASVGEYEVEKLNELMIRLINYYTETVHGDASDQQA